MAVWRVFLSDESVGRVHIIPGEPTVVAAWVRRQVTFFDLQNGKRLGDRSFDMDLAERDTDDWRDFLRSLTAPNDGALPVVPLPSMTLYLSDDGRMRLLQPGQSELYLDVEGVEKRLPRADNVRFVAAAFDRSHGLVALLDSDGKLHTYQQHIRIGVFNLGLKLDAELRPAVAVADEGVVIYATDGQQLVAVTSTGEVLNRTHLHYIVGEMACSTDGKRLVVSEREVGVIRVYDGSNLRPTRQRFAVDLMLEARRPRLTKNIRPESLVLGSVAITDRGWVAFSLSGLVCVSNVARMGSVPRLGAE
jgi:hypothetical protein